MDEYLAGFIDGEGSIAVGLSRSGKGVRRWYLRFSCHQINPAPLRLLQDRFGGTIRRNERVGKRPLYEWVTQSKMAAAAIRALRPYLIVKADEADVALEFQELVGANPPGRRPHLTPDQEEARHSLYLKLRELKLRNYDET